LRFGWETFLGSPGSDVNIASDHGQMRSLDFRVKAPKAPNNIALPGAERLVVVGVFGGGCAKVAVNTTSDGKRSMIGGNNDVNEVGESFE
jgi:hypothetical protein